MEFSGIEPTRFIVYINSNKCTVYYCTSIYHNQSDLMKGIQFKTFLNCMTLTDLDVFYVCVVHCSMNYIDMN